MATVEQPAGLLEAAVTRWAALDRGWQAITVAGLVTIGASLGLQIPW
jgi:hypothetical protein